MFLINVHGEKLIYNGQNVQTGQWLEGEVAKKSLLEALNKGRLWNERSGLNYDKLGKMSEDIMISNLESYENTVKDIKNQNFDKAEMQKATLQRHLDLKKAQLAVTKQKYIESHNEKMLPAVEGKFSILRQKIEDRLLKIENNKNIKAEKTDVCMVLVKAG